MPDNIPEVFDPAEDCPWRTPREILASHGYAPLPPTELDDRQLPGRLWELLYAAAARRFFFISTDHLSDREFYTLLWEQWLDEPTADIPLEAETNTTLIVSEFNANGMTHEEIWLRYYARADDQKLWHQDDPDFVFPPHENPPFDRDQFLPTPPIPLEAHAGWLPATTMRQKKTMTMNLIRSVSRKLIAKSPPRKLNPLPTSHRRSIRRTSRSKRNSAPHWLPDNTKFWYRNDLPGGAKESILVDVEKGNRAPAFDQEKLALGLAAATGGEHKAGQLPFSEIEFTGDGRAVQFGVAGKTWQCDLSSYQCTLATNSLEKTQSQNRGRNQNENAAPADSTPSSPDGKWTASVKDCNVFIRSVKDGQEIQLMEGPESLGVHIFNYLKDSDEIIYASERDGWRHLYLVDPKTGGIKNQITKGEWVVRGINFIDEQRRQI